MTSLQLFRITLTLKRPRVANSAEIVKVQPCFLKEFLKTQKKVKKIRNYVLKCNQYLYFLI